MVEQRQAESAAPAPNKDNSDLKSDVNSQTKNSMPIAGAARKSPDDKKRSAQDSQASQVPIFSVPVPVPVTMPPNVATLPASNVEDAGDPANPSGPQGNLDAHPANSSEGTVGNGSNPAFQQLIVQATAPTPSVARDSAAESINEPASHPAQNPLTKSLPKTPEANTAWRTNMTAAAFGDKSPFGDPALQKQEPRNAQINVAPGSSQPQTEPAKTQETAKTRTQQAEMAAAIAVDPKVQNAVAAILASAETNAAGAHSSHAAIKLPVANVSVKSVNSAIAHPATNSISSLPDSTTTHAAATHERNRKDATPSPARASGPVSPEIPAAKTSSNGNTSQADASTLPAGTGASANSHDNPATTKEPATSHASSPAVPTREPQDLPHVGTIVNSASLLEQMGKSEIKVGVRVGEFGNVEIRTQVEHQQVRAEISVAHHELGQALAVEMPALQQKLRDQDVPVLALNLTGQGAGNPSDPQSGPRQGFAATPQMSGAIPGDTLPGAQIIEQIDTRSGLDIRI
jgi:hypothetical protein